MQQTLKVLFFSDIHVRETGSFPPFNRINPETGLTYESENILLGADFVVEQILKEQPQLVVLGGDIVQTTEIQTARTLCAIARFLRKVRDACRKTNSFLLGYDGNHDILSTIHGITNTAILDPWFDMYLAEPRVVEFQGYKLGVIPYMDDRNAFITTFNSFQSQCNLLFTHQDYHGCRYNSSSITSSSPYSPQSKVPVISGDIHLPQVIGDVYYPGSLIQHVMEYPDLSRVGGIIVATLDQEGKFRSNFIKNNISRHYVKVNSTTEVLKFKPSEAVFTVLTDEDPEEVHKVLSGYWYHYIPMKKTQSDEKRIIEMQSRVDPVDMMGGYIQQNKPEAYELFNRLIKKEKSRAAQD
jgi:DNA repair exonuclease SbcCD nuclease subunit